MQFGLTSQLVKQVNTRRADRIVRVVTIHLTEVNAEILVELGKLNVKPCWKTSQVAALGRIAEMVLVLDAQVADDVHVHVNCRCRVVVILVYQVKVFYANTTKHYASFVYLNNSPF